MTGKIIFHEFGGPPTLVLTTESAARPETRRELRHRLAHRPDRYRRRFEPPVVPPREPRISLDEQIACAKATAARYREFQAMAGRPVKQIQMRLLAEKWEAQARALEAIKHGRQQGAGELFEEGAA